MRARLTSHWWCWRHSKSTTRGPRTASIALSSTVCATTRRPFVRHRITYYPYVEPAPGHGRGLLEALGRDACVVITDEFPCFFLPRIVAAAGSRLDVRLEAVDSNGLIPLAAADHAFTTAASYRRWVQKTLAGHLDHLPRAKPLDDARLERLTSLPREIQARWAPASDRMLLGDAAELARLPIDHEVPVVEMRGGSVAAAGLAQAFHEHQTVTLCANSTMQRNRTQPAGSPLTSTSGTRPRTRCSTPSRATKVLDRRPPRCEGDGPARRMVGNERGGGSVPRSAVTWRELGYNFCAHRADYDQYESLPSGRAHVGEACRDPRAHVYTVDRHSRPRRPTTFSGTPQGTS